MNELVRRMLSLLDGVEGTYTCRCGRGLKVGTSSELWHVRRQITQLLEEKCKGVIPNTFIVCGEGGNYCSEACHSQAEPATTPEEGTRFALLEVD
jgi:hypothetical protein